MDKNFSEISKDKKKIPFRIFEDRRQVIYLVCFLLLFFITLTVFVNYYPPTTFDIEFSDLIQSFENTILLNLMNLVSWFGGTYKVVVLTLGTALIFLIASFKREAIFIASTGIISIINGGIKVLIERPRPTEEFVKIIKNAKHHSFPSGHTSFYVVFFGFLAYLMIYNCSRINNLIRKPVILFSVLLIALVPFSRIYLGVHWITDVIGGFVLGMIMLILMIHFYIIQKN